MSDVRHAAIPAEVEPIYASFVAGSRALAAVMGWRIRIDGLEHLPARGPAVVAANHVSYLDWLPLVLAARRRGRYLRFMAKQSLFETPVAGAALRRMNHIPVARDVDGSRSLQAATRLLGDDHVVAVFPEATISVSFVPMTLKPGAALLARAANAPLVPFAAYGAQRLATKRRARSIRRDVTIVGSFGPPVDVGCDTPDEVTERLGARLREMVDQLALRYPDDPGPGEAWWVPEHLGGGAPSVAAAEELRAREARARRAGGT